MSMTETVTEESKAPRKKVAEHWLIDANGATVEDEKLATGIGYKLVDLPDQPFTFQVPGAIPANPQTMLAIFGAKTLATNESSQARNNPKGEASAQEQMDAVRERFALIESGEWIDRSREGGVGAKIDKDALAMAMKEVKPDSKSTVNEIRARLETDVVLLRNARQVPEIAAVYARIVGKPTKTVDDLLF